MSQNTKDFYNEMKEHSRKKVAVYQHYLKAYFPIMHHVPAFNEIHLYESHCGAGVYEDGNVGSSIVLYKEAIESVKNQQLKNKAIKPINLWFNDKNEKYITTLENEISQLEPSDFVKTYYSSEDFMDFLTNCPKKVAETKSHHFFFIDPFGYTGITKDFLHSLIKSEGRECLIFLPISMMYRFFKSSLQEPEKYKPLHEFMSSLYSSDDLNKLLDDLDIESSTHKLDMFILSIRDALSMPNNLNRQQLYYTSALKIPTDSNNHNTLFFTTKSPLGMQRMLESFWKEAPADGYTVNRIQPSIFGDVEFRNELIDQLQLYSDKAVITNKKLYCWGLINGRLPKHINHILKELENSSQIEVEVMEGQRQKKGLYISYEAYNNQTPILRFRWRNPQ